jgi:hypothetical protein
MGEGEMGKNDRMRNQNSGVRHQEPTFAARATIPPSKHGDALGAVLVQDVQFN